MRTVMVRYKVRPDAADENQRLIEAVFAQLASERPAGLRYQSFRLADGVSFMHVASTTGPGPNPLVETAAFKAFSAGIKARCEEPPVTTEMQVVGAYEG
jgi:hypothetical protein